MKEILIKGWQLNILQIFILTSCELDEVEILQMIEGACFAVEMGFRDFDSFSTEVKLGIEYQKLINQLHD